MQLDEFKKNKDKPINTLLVAGTLCLICALVVSSASAALKSIQEANIALDVKKNLLAVTKFPAEKMASADLINQTFKDNFDVQIIKLESGEEASEACLAAMKEIGKKDWTKDDIHEKYNQFLATKTKKPAVCEAIPAADDYANVKYREKFSHVYVLKNEDGSPKSYVFPVRGYGLWSMMRGFLSVKPDFQTVEGLVFYEQAETPGLGGEVKSEGFKKQWAGKQLYADNGDVQIRVIKNAEDNHSIDALSGATITSNGVTNAMRYWMGPFGFKKYIDLQKAGGSNGQETSSMTVDGKGVNNG